jgi:hypothetical protein
MPFRATAAAYESPDVPEERVLRDLWRAALGDIDGHWASRLSSNVIESLADIAIHSSDPSSGMARATQFIAESKASSIATEAAKRAIATSFGFEDRRAGFIAGLFASVTDYLVSRDLSGHVGRSTRNATVLDAIEFKARLRARSADIASSTTGDARSWEGVVSGALRALADK